ncbi:hypothetical protein F5876DRAFT_75245 [Lentinula aff. lateritia]|uniref:Uncharacterized protein n=1 Tax=Lentinula aff. lateritia TaxID=2804960 RepID=A0ACC1U5S0_9AGAR|nr:hypothetical protein F5876DRAFT_75245 [Lentinula aff. lateritia]
MEAFEFESFAQVEDVTLASKFLHAYLNKTSEGLFKPSLELCTTSLTVDLSLHDTLKAIHLKRDLDALERLRVHLERNSWRYHPSFDMMNQVIRAMESTGKIQDVAVNEFNRPVWSPLKSISDTHVVENIQKLQIPLGKSEKMPLVILHKLGSFQHDSLLRKRLNRIFSPLNHTFLVNTSGTGKTRLLFEGLCLHWGFYLTCAIDTSLLGAGDFAHVVTNVSDDYNWKPLVPPISDPTHTSVVHDNIHVVYRTCSEALLARLLIFNVYLKACSKAGFSHDQRRRWLESQIFPPNLISAFDPFWKIKNSISTLQLSDSILDEAISHTLEDIQSIWDMPAGEYFYVVLDEANVASTKHRWAFSDEYGRYPILKEMLRALRRRLGHLPVRFVVSGTIIQPEHFQSAVGEWDDFRWCSDTGSFDNSTEHRRYVSQFLPPELVKSITGQALLDRSWQWLRGRHRYTSSFIAVLLSSGFERPHSLLGNYIENISNYFPPDNPEYTSGESVFFDKWYDSLGDSGLSEGWISIIEMHRSVISSLVTSHGCRDCSTNERALISEDYGFFIDPDCSQIALDEPLTIMYGAGWLRKTNKRSRFQITNFDIFDSHHGTDARASHFAFFLALSFAFMFDGLSEVSNAFTIYGISTSFPQAKLVTFIDVGPRLEARDVHFTDHTPDRLVLLATTSEEALCWFKHERDEPFCVLQYCSSTSATLVFCLQFSDARTFWVFVRVPSTFQNKEGTDFARDIQDLHPTEMFRDQSEVASLLNQIPDLCLDAGPSGIMRISGSFRVEEATETSIPHELSPCGILNIEGLSGAAKSISEDMLMRRLSRIFSQRNEVTIAPPVSATEAPQEQGEKRGRSTTTSDDDAGTATSRTSRSRTKQHAKSTRSDHAASSGSSTQAKAARKGAGRSLRSRRISSKISNITTGRASASAPRSDRVEPTASSSSHTSPYNLRKR